MNGARLFYLFPQKNLMQNYVNTYLREQIHQAQCSANQFEQTEMSAQQYQMNISREKQYQTNQLSEKLC